jgi:hypothetical protein
MSQFVELLSWLEDLCTYSFRDSDADEHLGFVLPERRIALGFVLPKLNRSSAMLGFVLPKRRDRAASVGMVELGSFGQNGVSRSGSFCQTQGGFQTRPYYFCREPPSARSSEFNSLTAPTIDRIQTPDRRAMPHNEAWPPAHQQCSWFVLACKLPKRKLNFRNPHLLYFLSNVERDCESSKRVGPGRQSGREE